MIVRNLEQLADVVAAHAEIYLRHSRGPKADMGQTSRDYESGLELPGLSVVPLSPPEWWTRPVADWLARQVCKYAHVAASDAGKYAWILTGQVAGMGPDHEPLVACPRPLATLSDTLIQQAQQHYHERFDVGLDSPAARPRPAGPEAPYCRASGRLAGHASEYWAISTASTGRWHSGNSDGSR